MLLFQMTAIEKGPQLHRQPRRLQQWAQRRPRLAHQGRLWTDGPLRWNRAAWATIFPASAARSEGNVN